MRLLYVITLSFFPVLAGCSSLDARLVAASDKKGRASARVALPTWPEDCRKAEAHAPLVAGTEVRSVLKRERKQLDRANARVKRCAEHYDDLKERLK